MKALLNKVIPVSFIDGPGSRMVLFLQGCNMRCLYCHNPETQNPCQSCGACLAGCPGAALSFAGDKLVHNAARCRSCDRCLAECARFSSPKCREVTVAEVYRQIEAARDFLDGITVSGGEATLQWEFVCELFRKVKEAGLFKPGSATFLDTNGLMPRQVLERLFTVTDGFMVDLKAYDSANHRKLTGTGNAPILENIRWLGATDRLFEIRTVLVPGFTDTEAEIRNIAAFVRDLNHSTQWKLIPFRSFGVRTYLSNAAAFDDKRFQELWQAARQILGERVVAIS